MYTALLALTLILLENSENQSVFGIFSCSPITLEVRQVDSKSAAAIRLKQISNLLLFGRSAAEFNKITKFCNISGILPLCAAQLVWIYLCLN